jgi:hypothetical protein
LNGRLQILGGSKLLKIKLLLKLSLLLKLFHPKIIGSIGRVQIIGGSEDGIRI